MRVQPKCRRESCANSVKNRVALYCSVKCQQAYQQEQYISAWMSGIIDGSKSTGDGPSMRIRRYLLEAASFRCSLCGWGERNPRTGLVPLHLDHIDGNAANNRPDNLRILCPNHHALTETFGNANKGNGRPRRRARYLKGIRFSALILAPCAERLRAKSRSMFQS